MDRKNFDLILKIACVCFAVIAVVLFVFGIVYDGDHLLTKILMIVVALLSLALAGELAYLVWFSDTGDAPNYFLYDSNTKKNVSVDKLTFGVVSKRMDRYFANYAPSEGKLWTDGVLDAPGINMEEAFKPLVAYKLLFDLADRDMEKGWKCFEAASYQTVDFVCSSIEMNGEAEVAGNIRKMKQIQPFQVRYIRDYLVSNKDYLQTKMMMYVRDNIEKFQ